MISIRRTRSEKLLSLKAKPKSQDETVGVDPGEESESMEVLGSNRSVLRGGGGGGGGGGCLVICLTLQTTQWPSLIKLF